VHYRALISALHRANQKRLPISAAAAGLPQIPRLTGDARSYAERLFDFPTIANLDAEAATAALVEPARAQGVDYDKDALALALDWTEGYPFYIQQIGKHAWNQASASQIELSNVEDAQPAAQAALDRANALDDDDLEKVKADIDRFVRFYAFLSQVLPYVPPATERLYRFSHLLRDRFDSTPDGGAVNLAGQIDLTHFRLEELGTENIRLGGDTDPLSAIRGDGTGSAIAPKDVPMGLLGELVELFNQRFGADLTDADALRPLL